MIYCLDSGVHHIMTTYTCDQCQFTTSLRFELELHKIKSHNTSFHCEVCGRFLPISTFDKLTYQKKREDLDPENIHQAAMLGSVNLLKDYLSKGADINAKDKRHSQSTPLMYAARVGHLAVLHYLIHNGANVNIVDNVGDTAILKSIKGNKKNDIKKETVLALLYAGANPNLGKWLHFGNIIDQAAKMGDPDFAATCIAYGARQVHASELFYGHTVPPETKEKFQALLNNPLSLESLATRLVRSCVGTRDPSELPLPHHAIQRLTQWS